MAMPVLDRRQGAAVGCMQHVGNPQRRPRRTLRSNPRHGHARGVTEDIAKCRRHRLDLDAQAHRTLTGAR